MANTLKFGNGQWGTKVGSALAYNDEDGNFKPLPFNFTRSTSGTRINKDGLIEVVTNNKPRIDFKDDAKGALLLEPSRTNLITYSEDFSQWGTLIDGTGVVPNVTSNFAISPDGTQNADKIVFSRASSGGSDYTLIKSDYGGADINGIASIYLKSDSNVDIEITSDDVNYQTITVTTEWKRFEVSDTTSDRLTFGLRGSEPSTLNATIYAWGAQLEAGSYATSYIPTQGAISTREGESCSQTPPVGIIGQTEGTLFVNVNLGKSTEINTSVPIRFNLNNGISTANWVFIGIEGGDDLRVYVRANASNSVDFIKNAVFPSSGNYKIGMSFKSNKTVCYVNGVLQYSVNLGIVPNNLNSIGLGGAITGDAALEKSQTKEVKLYNTALTDAELQALTS